MEKTAILILAAGLGKRMGHTRPKVLSTARSRPLIEYVLKSAQKLCPERIVVITGFGKEQVEKVVASSSTFSKERVVFAFQKEQLGTGDAVKSALPNLKDFVGTILILYGDVPLIDSKTLESFLLSHHQNKATLSILSFETRESNSYGRIVRDQSGKYVSRIVEAKDCSPSELLIAECNSGVYAVESSFLAPAIAKLTNQNAQREYYLTDIAKQASDEGQTVIAHLHPDAKELLGVNTMAELKSIDLTLMRREIDKLIDKGVQIDDPNTLYLDPEVKIEAGCKIGPNVQLRGATKLAAGVTIEGSALLIDSEISRGAQIRFCVKAEGAKIGANSIVGPFANLRAGSELKDDVKVGNFVETKNAVLKKGAKASHLTYLGDAEIGEDANIGAGTITCNFDGKDKHKTTIGKEVFIGSNSALVAPVTIGEGAYVGAGSVITKDVEPGALALTRGALTEKSGWAKRKSAKH